MHTIRYVQYIITETQQKAYIFIHPYNAKAVCSKHMEIKIFEKHLNPIMLVFIG